MTSQDAGGPALGFDPPAPSATPGSTPAPIPSTDPGTNLSTTPETEQPPADRADRPRRAPRSLLRPAAFAGISTLLGAVVGVIWERVVALPVYTVGADGTASTTERGLAGMFGSDAWFCALGFVACIGLGMLTWRWFNPLGWPMVLIGLAGSELAALVCWLVGTQLGPGPFTTRMAAAAPGDVVPVDLTLHTPVSLVVWAFAVVIPLLVRTSLGPDDEDQARTDERRARRAARRSARRSQA